MKKAVIFDLDGTLTNTLADIANAMNGALSEFGLPGWAEDDYRYLVGNGAKVLAQRAVRDRHELAEAVLRSYQARYEVHCMDLTRPYDGIPELLGTLNERGVRVCVFSNKPDADSKHVVMHYFPDVRFDAIRGQIEGIPVKPDPAGALLIASELGLEPGDFLYLGDTAVDMTCACRAGMHPIGALWGFRDEKELREAGAEQLISEPLALLDLL